MCQYETDLVIRMCDVAGCAEVMMAGLCDPMFLAQLTSIPIRHTLVKNDLYIGHTLDTTNYTSQNTIRISILSFQHLRLRKIIGLPEMTFPKMVMEVKIRDKMQNSTF